MPGRALGRARGAATCSGSSRSATPTRAGSSSTSAGRAATTRSARTSPGDVRPPEAERHFVPFEVHGEGVYQLPVGPIHAGVIEPGHFRFSAIGERVLHLDARLFFTHRGLEKLVEGRSFAAALPIVERACGVCTVTHALAYAQAVEQLTGTEIPPRARWARVLLAELERLYNHVGDLGNICAGIGFQSGRLTARLAQGAAAPGQRRADRPPLPDRGRRPRRAR